MKSKAEVLCKFETHPGANWWGVTNSKGSATATVAIVTGSARQLWLVRLVNLYFSGCKIVARARMKARFILLSKQAISRVYVVDMDFFSGGFVKEGIIGLKWNVIDISAELSYPSGMQMPIIIIPLTNLLPTDLRHVWVPSLPLVKQKCLDIFDDVCQNPEDDSHVWRAQLLSQAISRFLPCRRVERPWSDLIMWPPFQFKTARAGSVLDHNLSTG